MADAGVNQYTFHVEPVENVATVCRKVREAGMKVYLNVLQFGICSIFNNDILIEKMRNKY